MAWQLYRLRFRVLSPLHIGHLPLGNILRTRSYVPGKTWWGAVTAALVQRTIARPTPADFESYGDGVRATLRFGYFVPVAGEEEPGQFPSTSALASEEFEYRFLDTYASTAMNSVSGAAEENSLHEIEVIRAATFPDRTRLAAPVFLTGFLTALETPETSCGAEDVICREQSLRSILASIQIGGKRGYGFGRVALSGWQCAGSLFGASFDPSGELALPAGSAVPAHVWNLPETPLLGKVEPFVGREWRELLGNGAGQYIPSALLCYAPGAILGQGRRFRVGDYGVWEALA